VDFALKQSTLPSRLPSSRWLILAAAVLAFGATYFALCEEEIRLRDERLAALDSQVRFAVISADTKIEIELQQLRDLAQSAALKRRQFDEFYLEARVFAERTRRQVVLHDVMQNAQIFNTVYPLHANLQEGARFIHKSEIDRLRPDRAYVSNLFYAPLVQKNLIAAAVPVSEGGRVLYLLGVAVETAEILAALKDVSFVAGTITAIVDRKGTIVARSAENDSFTGRTAPTNAAARAEKSGRYKSVTFDGTPVNISYLQSELSGWAAVSFVQDRSDSQWPLVAALLAALFTIVCGSILVVVRHAAKRLMREDES
jgi:hypothetical protein